MTGIHHMTEKKGNGVALFTKDYIPRVIFWELTEGCNLKCIHCRATAQPIRANDELTTEQAFKVIDQISKLGNPIVILTGGEPLYRPDFFEIANYANTKGLTLAMASNGTLINSNIAKSIKQSGIRRVAISFDGPNASIHDQFRGLPGSFEDAIRGAKAVQDQGIELQFNTTITKHNVNKIEQMLQLAQTHNVHALHLFMLVPVGCGVEIVENNMLTAEEYENVLGWFYDRSREVDFEIRATCAPHYYRIMREKAKENGERITRNSHGMAAVTKGCLAGTGVFFLSHKGKVRPCGYLPLEAGDILKQPLQDIWDYSPLFQTLRNNEMLEGKCAICEYVNVCSGCRARAYYETGNMMTDEPYCTYEPNRL
ncbi:radical SAM protein [Evansella sp. AB-P1]|uniref:radical SAM/SPASM domain-containing protein n=1 Tax=Evansella sp. AB-P1 TaxID=3037653 RepID=UPI00241F5170|nr:radical SAM protein [Evansella sp. AB-P1]MDG5789509.1 radical SAM protein [Evansella sp. AB-P1]